MSVRGTQLLLRAFASLLVISAVGSAGYLLARNTGISGRTTLGCNCHENNPNTNGEMTASITGPQTVTPNSVHEYTISVAGSPAGTYGGFDLATSGGTFLPGPGTQILSGELTHSEPTHRSWTFQWQAPATEGTYGFVGVGQACDGDGDNAGDSWNYVGGFQGAEFAITVSSAVGVDSPTRLVASLAPAWPNPFTVKSYVEFDLPAAGRASLEVFDPSGRRVAILVSGQLPAGRHQASWDGRSIEGSEVASGLYFLRLQTEYGVSTRQIVKIAR